MRMLLLLPLLAPVLCSCSDMDIESMPHTYDYRTDSAAEAEQRNNAIEQITSDEQNYDSEKGHSPQQVERANNYYNSEINNLQAGAPVPSQ